MTTLKCKKIRANLTKKGFVEEKDRDHYYYFYTIDGKKSSIHTKISHSAKEIGEPLISAMAKQSKLEKSQFMDLVNCNLSGEEYLCLLKNKSI